MKTALSFFAAFDLPVKQSEELPAESELPRPAHATSSALTKQETFSSLMTQARGKIVSAPPDAAKARPA